MFNDNKQNTPHKDNNRIIYFTIALIIILVGHTLLRGMYEYPVQVYILALAWLILFLPFLKRYAIIKNNIEVIHLIKIAFLINIILFFHYDMIEEATFGKIAFSDFFHFKFLAILFFIFYYVKFEVRWSPLKKIIKHIYKYKFIYLLTIAFILRLGVMAYSTGPWIDVYWAIGGGAESLMQGENPYSAEFLNPYPKEACLEIYNDADCKNDKYAYMPATLIFSVLFRFLFSDPRVILMYCFFGMSLIIYSIVKNGNRENKEMAEILALFVLYLPLNLLVMEKTWVEPLSLLFFYLAIYLYIYNFKYLPYIAFGISLATKQTMFAFVPFLLFLKDINIKKIIVSTVTVLIFVIPFLLWNFWDFVSDVFLHQLQMNDALHSISFMTISKIHFNYIIPPTVYLPILLALFCFLMYQINKNRDIVTIIHSITLFLFALFLIKRGFVNYYYLIQGLLILLVSLEVRLIKIDPSQTNT
ncbi:hypothetical protein KKA15_03135 [Patescibacteria group bacterium]|nr:hypothetical protein [Patescibacteria group bacterium]